MESAMSLGLSKPELSGLSRLRTQRPGVWVWLTQAAPLLVLGFAAAIAVARHT
jgi:hypothetical protein